jgi:5-deoxy-glucuronate isomerase
MMRHTDIRSWNIVSSDQPGMHEVIVPGIQDCSHAHMRRLNLSAGEKFELYTLKEEVNAVQIKGNASVTMAGETYLLGRLDSFYAPGKECVVIEAQTDCVYYLAMAKCLGEGKCFVRTFDFDQPLGDIHTRAGEGSATRDVFFTVGPNDAASHLLCGLTFGGNGGWTSWPPHQHEKDLEEVYAYFDLDAPMYGLHISYLDAGQPDAMAAHVVHSGHMVLASAGYHPTVAAPGARMSYFWALFAYSHAQRRYDIAVSDPHYLPNA